MIRVWSDGQNAGVLDRHGARGSTFMYNQGIDEGRAVSMTMPVRLASWDQSLGIHPIFEMNLPEGALRERANISQPRLRAAYIQFLETYAGSLSPGAPPDADYVARSLQQQTNNVLGRAGAKLLIGTILIN